MSRAADYVVALRTAATGSSTKATSNTYVTSVKNAILANTNTYIAATLANTNTYIAATVATVTAKDAEHDLGTLIALGLG
jgi:hypothetical protein